MMIVMVMIVLMIMIMMKMTTNLGKTRCESSTQSAFKVHSSLPGNTMKRKAPSRYQFS